MDFQFPHDIKTVSEEDDVIIKKYYKNYVRPFVRVGAVGYLATAGYADHAQDIYNLEVRPDDLWVTSYSRSGTTWLQELVWLVSNDLDFEGIKEKPVNHRYAFIEYPTHNSEVAQPPLSANHPKATIEDYNTIHRMKSPRYIKSHLPLSLLPPKLIDTAKVFYIAREPRDVVVSYHFAHKLFRNFDDAVTLREFWDLFKKDLISHTPLFPHVKEAWDRRQHPNLMFLFYEDLQRDLLGAIDQVCAFLGKKYSAEEKTKLVEHLSFNNMKKRDIFKGHGGGEKTFFRKGQSKGWTQYFDENMKKEAEEYVARNLSKTDMRYPEPN